MSYQRDAELTQQVLTEIKAERDQLREQNRVLATKLSEAAVLAKEIKDEFDMCTHECERCGESDSMTNFDIYRTVVQIAALTATSQPTAAEVHQRMFDHGDATSQEGQG